MSNDTQRVTNSQLVDDSFNYFDNSTTLRIFLYVRSLNGKDIGIRETQRALDLKSPSTASWHLEKLQVAGFVEKLDSNRYMLTSAGKSLQEFSVPLTVSVRLMKGFLIPKFLLLFLFLIFDILFSILLWIKVDDPLIIGINGVISLIISLLIMIYIWIVFNQQMTKFTKM